MIRSTKQACPQQMLSHRVLAINGTIIIFGGYNISIVTDLNAFQIYEGMIGVSSLSYSVNENNEMNISK